MVNNHSEWMKTHTTPIASAILRDRIRVYFACRGKQDMKGNFVSNTSFVDVDIANPLNVININTEPILYTGGYGYFDEFGVMVTDVLNLEEKLLLYYAGWQRLGGGTAAYQVMLGIAESKDGGTKFKKLSNGPFMSIDYFDPISIGNVAVIKDVGVYRMYYTSLTDWVITGKKPTYEYRINYAESLDGVYWQKKFITCIDIVDGYGVATPCVIKHNDKYHMWFGFRKNYDEKNNIGGYKIGYAYSEDGVKWDRQDNKVGILPSTSGWDSQMMCYPSVQIIGDRLIMFYCGNEFGKEGFGYAECKIDEL